MAKFVWTNAFVSIAANDLSASVKKVLLDAKEDEIDVSTMGVGAYRSKLGGATDWTVDVDFLQDFALGVLDSLLFPLIGTTVAVIVRPDKTAAASATNPNYQGNMALIDYQPVQADVGVAAIATVKLHGAGVLTRSLV